MTSLDCSPSNEIVAGLLLLISAMSAAHGTRRLMRGLRHARPLDVVHGIRTTDLMSPVTVNVTCQIPGAGR